MSGACWDSSDKYVLNFAVQVSIYYHERLLLPEFPNYLWFTNNFEYLFFAQIEFI